MINILINNDEIEFIKNSFNKVETMQTEQEAINIYKLSKYVSTLCGDFAEVGTRLGGSARIIAKAIGNNKTLHLFDTFDGIPSEKKFFENPYDDLEKSQGCPSNIEDTMRNLSEFSNITKFYKGYFEDNSYKINNNIFSFVHFDADIYSTCMSFLNFFYPRMITGGIILVHDLDVWPGVRPALENFFNDKIENFEKIEYSQGLIIIKDIFGGYFA